MGGLEFGPLSLTWTGIPPWLDLQNTVEVTLCQFWAYTLRSPRFLRVFGFFGVVFGFGDFLLLLFGFWYFAH
jgi:hypothetical protein